MASNPLQSPYSDVLTRALLRVSSAHSRVTGVDGRDYWEATCLYPLLNARHDMGC